MNSVTAPRDIGDRPLSLVPHLRHIAGLLAGSHIYYNWKDSTSCNCGLLACSLLGVTPEDLKERLEAMSRAIIPQPESFSTFATWKKMATVFCPLNPTLSRTSIFKELTAAGLEPEDFAHLEYLEHPELRLNWYSATAFEDKNNLIIYLTRWADRIEAFHAQKASNQEVALEVVETRPLVNRVASEEIRT